MGRTLDEMVAGLPARRRKRIQARTIELIGEEMTLRDLRRAMGKTQAQIAKLTGKPQATISRMEAQSDMLLSNLDRVVGALGGRVRIVAELPGRAPVLLTGFGELASTSTVGHGDARGPAKMEAKPIRPIGATRSGRTAKVAKV